MGDSRPEPFSAKKLIDLYPGLGIPHFQRGLVWNDDMKALLLESLYYETPCGNILLWRPLKRKDNGVPLKPGADFEKLIVDGQQRIRMLHEASQDIESEGGQKDEATWCLDLTVEPSVKGSIAGEQRRSLFVKAKIPQGSKGGRNKHNLVPVSALMRKDKDPAGTLQECKIEWKDGVELSQRETLLSKVSGRVKSMWTDELFYVITLEEEADGGVRRYGIDHVVSLYNRINSAGSKVNKEELAYATLVRSLSLPQWNGSSFPRPFYAI